jgi:hypothetical protein
MRWREEVTLTTYEMQWTVRYFTHKSIGWADRFNNTAQPRAPSNSKNDSAEYAGALAYSNRKYSTWNQLAIKSDRIFKICNNAYKSPL